MFGEYGAFIVPAYLLTAFVIAALAVRVQWQYWRLRRELEQLSAGRAGSGKTEHGAGRN